LVVRKRVLTEEDKEYAVKLDCLKKGLKISIPYDTRVVMNKIL